MKCQTRIPRWAAWIAAGALGCALAGCSPGAGGDAGSGPTPEQVNQTMQQDMAEAFKKRQEAEQRQSQGGAAPTTPAASPN